MTVTPDGSEESRARWWVAASLITVVGVLIGGYILVARAGNGMTPFQVEVLTVTLSSAAAALAGVIVTTSGSLLTLISKRPSAKAIFVFIAVAAATAAYVSVPTAIHGNLWPRFEKTGTQSEKSKIEPAERKGVPRGNDLLEQQEPPKDPGWLTKLEKLFGLPDKPPSNFWEFIKEFKPWKRPPLK